LGIFVRLVRLKGDVFERLDKCTFIKGLLLAAIDNKYQAMLFNNRGKVFLLEKVA
jgi:hypothetical protein